MTKKNKICLICGKTIINSRNGLNRYCNNCKRKRKLQTARLRLYDKTCSKCGSKFEGSRYRKLCYDCNPEKHTTKEKVIEKVSYQFRTCIECGKAKKMKHGNQLICCDCKEQKRLKSVQPMNREISNVDFSALEKYK